MLEIRKANRGDENQIWNIIKEVISKGDTYTFDPDSSKETMLQYWFGQDKHTFVATDNGEITGTFVKRDNQPGLGSHIANASYMVSGKAGEKVLEKPWERFPWKKQNGLDTKPCNLISL